jgi:hypothetical protein
VERQWPDTTYRRTEDLYLPSQCRCHVHFRNALQDKSYLKLPKYTVYHTNHPAGTAHGETVIINTTIKHNLQCSYKQDFLQATSVSVEDSDGPFTISAVYLLPIHAIKQEQLEEFYNTLGQSQFS